VFVPPQHLLPLQKVLFASALAPAFPLRSGPLCGEGEQTGPEYEEGAGPGTYWFVQAEDQQNASVYERVQRRFPPRPQLADVRAGPPEDAAEEQHLVHPWVRGRRLHLQARDQPEEQVDGQQEWLCESVDAVLAEFKCERVEAV